jgi:hypothetical protein
MDREWHPSLPWHGYCLPEPELLGFLSESWTMADRSQDYPVVVEEVGQGSED